MWLENLVEELFENEYIQTPAEQPWKRRIVGNSLIVLWRFCCRDYEGCVENIYTWVVFDWIDHMAWMEAVDWTKLVSNMAAEGLGLKNFKFFFFSFRPMSCTHRYKREHVGDGQLKKKNRLLAPAGKKTMDLLCFLPSRIMLLRLLS